MTAVVCVAVATERPITHSSSATTCDLQPKIGPATPTQRGYPLRRALLGASAADMRAYQLHPKKDLDAISAVDLPSPPLSPRDVRVRVRAASLNFRDLAMARRAEKLPAPVIPLSDGAGDVIEVGAEVTRWKAGDRVTAGFFPTWADGPLSDWHHQNALGGGRDGMLAEEVVLPESSWVAVPAGYDYRQAACLPCAALTAWHALFEAHALRPGQTVLLQGTGGVSVFALQMAKATGATVIMTSSSAEKRARAKELGADHLIDYKTEPRWGEAAKAWNGGRGVDVVVEVGGAGTFDQSAAALDYGGTLALIGVLTGIKAEIGIYPILHKALRVRGIYVGSLAMFERMNRALCAARIAPVIDRVFAFDDARAAYAHLASAAHFGKVVIEV
jgi:NADPH:quinone reductase-like Zn-dependent oxidoreductase